MQSIYSNYALDIEKALKEGRKRGTTISKGLSGFEDLKPQNETRLFSQNLDEQLFDSIKALSAISGKKAKYSEKPGAHPDFLNIKLRNITEKHYITSMFIDIKNSTQLFKKYYPETVAYITNILQRAAVHTCWYFDGYVQRFHGDGLLVYFGGKKIPIKDSVDNAVNAASFFSYFVQNDLKNLFSEQGVEKIYTRIGIDAGEAEDVLWYLAGMGDCSEITTCSLHTSLAYKMQVNAVSNGIMVGDNIKNNTSLGSDLFSIKKTNDGEDRYIFQIPEENFHYTQWELNWQKHLKNKLKSPSENDLLITDQILEAERLAGLRNTSNLINTGNAFTNKSGIIGTQPVGIKNQEHRFHHDSENKKTR